MTVDQNVFEVVVTDRTGWLVDVVTVITHSGGTIAAWIVSIVATIVLLRRGRDRDAFLVAGAMLSGWAVMSLLKALFGRQRPPTPERLVDIASHSFPSGHAMMTAILVGVLAAVIFRTDLPRYVRLVTVVLLLLYTLMVGLSRVYLAAHWLSDVLAGWVFGALWAAFWILRTRTRSLRPMRHSFNQTERV